MKTHELVTLAGLVLIVGDVAAQANETFVSPGCESLALIAAAAPPQGVRAYRFDGTCSLSTTGKKSYGTISATFNPATNRANERTDMRLIENPNVRSRVSIAWTCNGDPFLRENNANCVLLSANSNDLVIIADPNLHQPLAYRATTSAAVQALNPAPAPQESFDCSASRVLSVGVGEDERRYKFAGTCTRRDPSRIFPASTLVTATWQPSTQEAFFTYDFTSGSRYMGTQRYRCETDPWIAGSAPAAQQCAWLGFTGNTMQVPVIGAGQVSRAALERATRRAPRRVNP
jgi:hypothetical protein